MFHSRKTNSKKNHLQEQSLRIVYDDYLTSFEHLLKRDNSFKIQHKNTQALAIELFKVKKRLLTQFNLNLILPLRSTDYKLRSQTDFYISSVNTVISV